MGSATDPYRPVDAGSREAEETGAREGSGRATTATATANSSSVRFKRDNKRSGGGRPARAPPALLLNTLKTGMRLQGRVVSCTHYAAFVNLDVYRAGKGDRCVTPPSHTLPHMSNVPL